MISAAGGKSEPTPGQLRWFGLQLAGFLAALGAVAWWKWEAANAAWLAWGLACAVGPLYYAVPSLRRPIFLGWRRIFLPLEQAVSLLALGAVYYGVVTPLGLIMRMSGRDTMGRRFDPSTPSYFVNRRPDPGPARYFQQF